MSTCMVLLVSEQTIPNIIAAYHFRPDFLLFISTKAMEAKRKSEAILQTLKMCQLDFDNRYAIIETDENNIMDIQEKVADYLKTAPDLDKFIINLTCGTKIMSIAAYDFFSDFDSTMIYIPLGKNEYISPFPKKQAHEINLINLRLQVAEYLCAYGIIITNDKYLPEAINMTEQRQVLTRFIYDNYFSLKPLLQEIGKVIRPLDFRKSSRRYDIKIPFAVNKPEEREFLKLVGFSISGQDIAIQINKDWANYLKGGWLEERLFLAVKQVLPQADVALGVRVKDARGNSNEFDVLFTLDNNLYNIECKSLEAASENDDEPGPTITDFLYKLGALRQQFGLTPKVFLATTAETIFDQNGELKKHLAERARQFNCEIIPLLKIKSPEDYLKNKFS